MKSLKFKVLGKDWKAKFLKDKAFIKKFNKEDSATTVFKEKTAYFNLSDFSTETIGHELFHVLLEEAGYYSVRLDQDRFEELVCELFGKHGEELSGIKWKIYYHVVPVELPDLEPELFLEGT